MYSKYNVRWECVCDRNGWDYDDSPGDHWDEMDELDKGVLEQLWHNEFDDEVFVDPECAPYVEDYDDGKLFGRVFTSPFRLESYTF